YGVLADGDPFGDEVLAAAATGTRPAWGYTATAATSGRLLALPRQAFQELLDRSPALRDQVSQYLEDLDRPANRKGEAEIELASGHEGERELPSTFADYE